MIDVTPVVTVRPAIKSAVAHRRHVIGHQIAAELIALVYCYPQSAALGLPRETNGIAKARRKDAMLPGGAIYLPDRGAVLLVEESVLHHVAV